MDTKFIINDYVLIWNLLFQASINESIYNLKQKLWNNYKDEFNKTFKDKELILQDTKNFIPNDDTIYNIVLETKEYDLLSKKAEKFRLDVMKIWDKNKKTINNCFKKYLRKDIKNYTIYIVNPEIDVIEVTHDKKGKGVVIYGKSINIDNPIQTIIEIVMAIVSYEVPDDKMNLDKQEIRESVLELTVLNELQTNIKNVSCYCAGNPNLKQLKRKLYPYWLMYLGIKKEDFIGYIIRDQISFDKDTYAYEKELIKMDLEEFINFCTRNKKYIVRPEKTEII